MIKAVTWKNLLKKALEIPKTNYFEFPGDSFQIWSQLRRAAVLLLFIETEPDATPRLIFTKRSPFMNAHRGQMSFPGGRFDPSTDKNLVECALRETNEEIGVSPKIVEIMGEYEDIITTSRYWLTPIVGWTTTVPEYRVNPMEVEKVVEIPVQWLWDQKHHVFRLLDFYRDGRTFTTYFFPPYQGEVVWGATASLLLWLFERIEVTMRDRAFNWSSI